MLSLPVVSFTSPNTDGSSHPSRLPIELIIGLVGHVREELKMLMALEIKIRADGEASAHLLE